MGALCINIPKQLLPVVGNEPIISRIVRQLFDTKDIEDVCVVTNERFTPAFLAWRENEPMRERIRILNDHTTSNADRLGANGDLRLALDTLDVQDDFCVVLGDNFLDFSFGTIADKFAEVKSTVVVTVKPENREDLRGYAVAQFASDGLVHSLVEKPDPLPPDAVWGAIGLYFYPAKAREWLSQFLSENPGADQPGRFPAWLVGRQSVYAVKAPGAFTDIGTPEAYAELRKRMNQSKMSGVMEP